MSSQESQESLPSRTSRRLINSSPPNVTPVYGKEVPAALKKLSVGGYGGRTSSQESEDWDSVKLNSKPTRTRPDMEDTVGTKRKGGLFDDDLAMDEAYQASRAPPAARHLLGPVLLSTWFRTTACVPSVARGQ